MRLTLRDLFWLMLLVAAVTIWVVDHRQARKEAFQRWFNEMNPDRHTTPTKDEMQRRAKMARLATLTDAELDRHLAEIMPMGRQWPAEHEPCLTEMAGRRLAAELQQHYDALIAQSATASIIDAPDDLELLTALRRAQGLSDPLEIQLKLDGDKKFGSHFHAPIVSVIIENVDVEQKSVTLLQGCDGTLQRWRFVLIDQNGDQVADSNFESFAMGGGTGTCGRFDYGAKSHWKPSFDLRRYLAPPPSGNYTLYVFHHDNIWIARQRDISGLIVIKSKPIPVIVENREVRVARRSNFRVPPPLAIAIACSVLTLAATNFRKISFDAVEPSAAISRGFFTQLSWRDFCWGLLVIAVTLGMWLDDHSQLRPKPFSDQLPDATADWSIRLTDE